MMFLTKMKDFFLKICAICVSTGQSLRLKLGPALAASGPMLRRMLAGAQYHARRSWPMARRAVLQAHQFVVQRANRNIVALAHDTLAALLAPACALWLRVGNHISEHPLSQLIFLSLVFTLVASGVFFLTRLYRRMWRYASLHDVRALFEVTLLTCVGFFPLYLLMTWQDPYPRSFMALLWCIFFFALWIPRLIYFFLVRQSGRIQSGLKVEGEIPVLVIGTGPLAELFVHESLAKILPYRVLGILSREPADVGRQIHGVDILGTLAGLPRALQGRGVKPRYVVIADDMMPKEVLQDLLKSTSVPLKRLASQRHVLLNPEDRLKLTPIRVEDLLGRRTAQLDLSAMQGMIHGQVVLITGAGGSIGGELARQIAALKPQQLILFEHNEYALYKIDMELGRLAPDVLRVAVIGDVVDAEMVESVFKTYQPNLVFHAGALKHVPLVEANPEAAVLTNVVGTCHIANAAARWGVRTMVMISTDKAIHPTSVMGATKRLAELYCQALDMELASRNQTRYVTVRFGNVLGSTGSVVPLFEKQIESGGPITITHPEMVRYFMTLYEAVQLVIQAAAFGNTPQSIGKIFLLNMGSPVSIVELAHQMIRLSGLEPGVDINIQFTGVRPGEKLFEELFYASETMVSTAHPDILIAEASAAQLKELLPRLEALEKAARSHDRQEALKLLKTLVPEYQTRS